MSAFSTVLRQPGSQEQADGAGSAAAEITAALPQGDRDTSSGQAEVDRS